MEQTLSLANRNKFLNNSHMRGLLMTVKYEEENFVSFDLHKDSHFLGRYKTRPLRLISLELAT